jgi:hypothetical protein
MSLLIAEASDADAVKPIDAVLLPFSITMLMLLIEFVMYFRFRQSK